MTKLSFCQNDPPESTYTILAKEQSGQSYIFWFMPIITFSPVAKFGDHPLCAICDKKNSPTWMNTQKTLCTWLLKRITHHHYELSSFTWLLEQHEPVNKNRVTKLLPTCIMTTLKQSTTQINPQYKYLDNKTLALTLHLWCGQLQSCHRCGPQTVTIQTAGITKCHVIFVVFFKF